VNDNTNKGHGGDIEMLVRGADATPFSKLAYHLINAEDEAIKEALADDIVWTMMPNGAVLDGKEQVFEFLKPAFASVEIRMPELIGNVALKDWGVLEYWNKGIIDDNAIAFAQSFWGQNRLPIDRDGIIGKEHKMAVCFVYHINTQGKIDLVREYLDIGSYITQAHPPTAQATSL
jgi:hypothetical protein